MTKARKPQIVLAFAGVGLLACFVAVVVLAHTTPHSRDETIAALEAALALSAAALLVATRMVYLSLHRLQAVGRPGEPSVNPFERDLSDLPQPALSGFGAAVDGMLGMLGRSETTRLQRRVAQAGVDATDALTGLPNRQGLEAYLEPFASDPSPDEPPPWVVVIGVQGVAAIALAEGSDAVKRLLQELAARLRFMLPHAVVGHVGSGRFVVIGDEAELGEIDRSATTLVGVVRAPARTTPEQRVHLLAAAGLRQIGPDVTPAQAIDDAIVAADAAHDQGRWVLRYDPSLSGRGVGDGRLEAALGEALAAGELVLNYQPVVQLASGRLVGFEALARWRQPSGEEIPPDEFIPVAERTGHVITLGSWALQEAAAAVTEWNSILPMRVSVNMSPIQLAHPGIVESVATIIRDSGAKRGWITLELTESVVVADHAAAARTLEAFEGAGFHIAIDDFGTGYSSLAVLDRLPFSFVKLDRDFLTEDGAVSPVARVIIDAVHSLGRRVLAEGVESQRQSDALNAIGCDLAQGWYFGSAVSREEATELVRRAARGDRFQPAGQDTRVPTG